MDIYFDIWVYSTDTYYAPGSDSEISLSSLGEPTVAEPEWIKIKVLGLDFGNIPAAATEIRNGIPVHCKTQFTKGTMQVYPLDFPDERDDMDDIYALFGKNYIYICMDGDNIDHLYPWRFHSEDKALMIDILDLPEPTHDYENGNKKLKIPFQKFFPVRA